MKELIKILIVFFFAFFANSCFLHRQSNNFVLYRGDRQINFPNEKLEISLINNSLGIFTNHINSNKTFIQKFNYEIYDTSFLVVSNLDTLNTDIISLNNNDTIIIYKKKMLFFYNGKEKYLLYFRKKRMPA